MSFISKGLKKVWKFVKDNWVQIALAAAVVFTAGVATVGFGAFAAQGFGASAAAASATAAGATGGFTGFMSAVGSTMWAGVTGAAGSMGIGQGAAAPAFSAAAEAGMTHVGFGAAWGAGANVGGASTGWGKAGQTAAKQAVEHASTGAYNSAAQKAIADGATKEAAKQAGFDAAKKESISLTGQGEKITKVGKYMNKAKAIGGKEGMTTAQATLLAASVGPAVSALGGSEEVPGSGAPIWYSEAGGKRKETRDYGTDAPDAPGILGPASGSGVAEQYGLDQMRRPLMGANRGDNGLNGRPEDKLDGGLMKYAGAV